MKNLKTIGAIFCTALLSFAFCGDAFADKTVVKTGKQKDKTEEKKSRHSNHAYASSGGVSLSTGNDTKKEHKPALPDGLSENNKYDVAKYEVEAGDTLQVTLKGNTYKCILFGVEVPKTWDSWQTEMSKDELKKILTNAKSIKMQVWNGKAKSKTRIGITDSDKDSTSGLSRGTTESESAPNRNLLVKLFVGNFDIGKEMIKQGYATCYDAEIDPKGMGATDYARVQKQAQSQKLGCWKEEK